MYHHSPSGAQGKAQRIAEFNIQSSRGSFEKRFHQNWWGIVIRDVMVRPLDEQVFCTCTSFPYPHRRGGRAEKPVTLPLSGCSAEEAKGVMARCPRNRCSTKRRIIANCQTSSSGPWNHRIIEQWSWKGPIRPWNPIPCLIQEYKSKFFLNASCAGALTTSQGNWYHCLTTLIIRKFFLVFNQNLASCNLSPLLRVLYFGMIENRSCPSSVWQPF